MDNANVNNEVPEITPELQAKLEQIQAEQEVVSKKEKKTGPLIAVTVVLLLVSAVCVAFSVMTKGKNKDHGADQNGITAPAPVLSELTDSEIKQKIDRRVDELNLIHYTNGGANKKGDSVLVADYIFTKNTEIFSNLRLSDNDKIYIVAANETLGGSYEQVKSEDYKATAVQKYKSVVSESDFLKNGKKSLAVNFAELYKNLFGEEIKHQTLEECGAIAHYSEDTGYYYFDFVGGCGGVDFREIILKKLSYQKSDDNYYIDLGVTTVFDGSDDDGKDVCAIFKGYYDLDTAAWKYNMENDKVSKKCKNGSTPSELSNEIGEGEMTKYRYTFDKDLHLSKIERL